MHVPYSDLNYTPVKQMSPASHILCSCICIRIVLRAHLFLFLVRARVASKRTKAVESPKKDIPPVQPVGPNANMYVALSRIAINMLTCLSSDVDSLLAVPVHDDYKMRVVPKECALTHYKEEVLADTYNDLVNLPYVYFFFFLLPVISL